MLNPLNNKSRNLQIACNGAAVAFWLLGGGFGWCDKSLAQLSCLSAGLGFAAIGSYHGSKSEQQQPYLNMHNAASEKAFAQSLALSITEVETEAKAQRPQADLRYFDWNQIKNNPDKWPHLAIVGGTGDGKSTLTQSLIQFLGEKAVAYDPHYKPGNYPGLPVVAKGRNYGNYPGQAIDFDELVRGADCSYTDAIATIFSEMDRRYKLMEKGVENFERYCFILDEYTTFAGKHPDCSKGEVLNLIREARKVGLRLILLVQSDLLEDFKWKGQGAARKSLRWCRLGDFALAHAKALKDEQLQQWVNNLEFPILVETNPATLPAGLVSAPFQLPQSESKTISISLPSERLRESEIIQSYLEKIWQLPEYQHPDSVQSDQPGSLNPERLNPTNSKDVQDEQTGSDVQNMGSDRGVDSPEPLNLELAARCLKLHHSGKNKAEIILELWQAKKGGNKAYIKANADFEVIKKYWNQLELW